MEGGSSLGSACTEVDGTNLACGAPANQLRLGTPLTLGVVDVAGLDLVLNEHHPNYAVSAHASAWGVPPGVLHLTLREAVHSVRGSSVGHFERTTLGGFGGLRHLHAPQQGSHEGEVQATHARASSVVTDTVVPKCIRDGLPGPPGVVGAL